MKTKTEVLEAASLVIDELDTTIQLHPLLTVEERKKAGFVIFTKKCPFQRYWRLFCNTSTAVPKEKRNDFNSLVSRSVFWNKFFDEVQSRPEPTTPHELDQMILYSALKVEKQL